MRTNITNSSMELIQSPNKNCPRHKYHVPFSFTDSTNRFKALHVNLYRSDVESFILALEQLHESFSEIGAHQDFEMPEFFRPELLQKKNYGRDGTDSLECIRRWLRLRIFNCETLYYIILGH